MEPAADRMTPERTSNGPLYRQIADYIRQKIDGGEWPVAYQVPTEQRLCRQFNVSRITVVKALGRLVDEGLLVREQGRGTFVAKPLLAHEPSELLSFSEEMRRQGKEPYSTILEKASEWPSTRLIQHLGLPGESRVWHIKRLMLADHQPIGVQTTWLPVTRFPELGDKITDNVSLYELLRGEYGVNVDSAVETYSALQLDAEEKKLLKADSSIAAFAVERLSFSRDEPIEFVTSVMRSDVTHYTVRLHRRVP